MMKRPVLKKVFYVAVAVVAVVLVALLGRQREQNISYATENIERGDITSVVRASGTLAPTKEAKIYPGTAGTVMKVLTGADSVVKKGQVLAVLSETEELSANLAHFQKMLEKAGTDFDASTASHEANRNLFEKKLISRAELNESLSLLNLTSAALEKAQAEVTVARKKLSAAEIVSILDGVVLEKNIIAGERITPGNAVPVFVIAENLSTLHLTSNVSESDIAKISRDNQAVFSVDAFIGEEFTARVSQISNSPRIRNGVVTYDVVCLVENSELRLKPGMTAEVRIVISEKKDVLRIPTAALRFIPPKGATKKESRNADKNVWILRNGKLVAARVETGISDDFYTEVAGGELSEGDAVVIEYKVSNSDKDEPGLTLPQPKRF